MLADGQKRIKYLSEAYAGSTHDYSILKAEMPPGDRLWFDEHNLWVDLGFLGIEKDYAPSNLYIPERLTPSFRFGLTPTFWSIDPRNVSNIPEV
ncbi:MAG: hypothetical protein EPGJADBJ_00856 [Saprospiraceae bacterium]|nr:hypothetical protein [Saprospiraceae bacterium]